MFQLLTIHTEVPAGELVGEHAEEAYLRSVHENLLAVGV